jgi:GDSL-like Lipase/Acylhydrolase family
LGAARVAVPAICDTRPECRWKLGDRTPDPLCKRTWALALVRGKRPEAPPNSSFPHGSHLAEAVGFLRAHRGFVSFVTIDIGADDVLHGGGPAAIAANLPVILTALRKAAGPDVAIVGMNYYSPRLVEWFSDPASLPGRVAAAVAFNNFLEGIYAAFGDPVADVESAFSTTDMTPVGVIPLDVLRICQWTWMCAPPPLGPDIHANTAGSGVIAHAFENVLNP